MRSDGEVLEAGGWSRALGIGDALSLEDVYVLLVCEGGLARTPTKARERLVVCCPPRRTASASPRMTLHRAPRPTRRAPRRARQANARAPTWRADERRAFTFRLRSPLAVLWFAALDADDDHPWSKDDPIGRGALPLRALAPGAW